MQKMHNALGAWRRSASARGRELIEKMGRTYDADGNEVPWTGEIDPSWDLWSWRHMSEQMRIRQNLRDSYPIWVKK